MLILVRAATCSCLLWVLASPPVVGQDWQLLSRSGLLTVAPDGAQFRNNHNLRQLERSYDGENWEVVYARGNMIGSLMVAPDSTLYLTTVGNSAAGSAFDYVASTDMGATWSDPCESSSSCVLRFQSGTVGDPRGARYYFRPTTTHQTPGQQGLFVHESHSSAWARILDRGVNDFAIGEDNSLWVLADDDEILLSADLGGTWTSHAPPCTGRKTELVQVSGRDSALIYYEGGVSTELPPHGYAIWRIGEAACELLFDIGVNSVSGLSGGRFVAHFPDLDLIRVYTDLGALNHTNWVSPPHADDDEFDILEADGRLLVVTDEGSFRAGFSLSATRARTQPGPLPMDVFPNPFYNRISIPEVSGDVEVYDMTGSLVFSGRAGGWLDLGRLPAGVYVLRPLSNGYAAKVIVKARTYF